jgi:RND family efflux transporter MFP subunit
MSSRLHPRVFWLTWAAAGVLVSCILVFAGYYALQAFYPEEAHAREPADPLEPPELVYVQVVRPREGRLGRPSVIQPATIIGYESAKLYAEVSGYLKTQNVDIGDSVKKGAVLAQIAVPELEKQEDQRKAAVRRAKAVVEQMKARVSAAEAKHEEAEAQVVQATANARTAVAMLRLREVQLARIDYLFKKESIDERVLDEKKEAHAAAIEAKNAADAAIITAMARVKAVTAQIKQAQADVDEARAEVEVAEAEWQKAKVMVDFATVTSPYTGIVTQRSQFPGDFVRAAQDGSTVPLLTVERIDRVKAVIMVPDQNVPFVKVGEKAAIQIDNLPGRKFKAKVSRLARAEDPQTRLMRVEVDLANPDGELAPGMFGQAKIVIDPENTLLTIPRSCLIGKLDAGRGAVYVVRQGKARLTTVRVGPVNNRVVGIIGGLQPDDLIVQDPDHELHDGLAVIPQGTEVTPPAPEE